jgi:hypothetical protein
MYGIVRFRYVEICFGRRTGHSVGRQYHNACVAFTQSYLIFGTDHARAFLAAYLRFLYQEWFAGGGVNSGAHRGYYHFLSGSYVRCAAHDLNRAIAHVYRGNAQLVGIRVAAAGKHLAYQQACKAAAYSFNGLNCFNLKTYRGKDSA